MKLQKLMGEKSMNSTVPCYFITKLLISYMHLLVYIKLLIKHFFWHHVLMMAGIL